MPYRRNYKKRGPVSKRVNVYGKAGVQLYRDVKYLKTLVNAELHHHIFGYSNNIDSNGAIQSMNNVPSGDSDSDRTGTSVLPRFMSVRLHVNKAISGPTHETVRVIIFRYWGAATSSAPVLSNISTILNTNDPLAYLQEENTGSKGDRERRIEVHKSKIFTLDQVSDTSRTYNWNIVVNGPDKQIKDHIKYRSQTTEQPISGGFYMLVITDNATGSNKSSINLRTKLGYYDN